MAANKEKLLQQVNEINAREAFKTEVKELEYEMNRLYLDALKKYGRYSEELKNKEDKINKLYKSNLAVIKRKHNIK